MVTGDYNPYHLDQQFAEGTWFGRRNIPGLLTASLLRQASQLAHSSQVAGQRTLCRGQ